MSVCVGVFVCGVCVCVWCECVCVCVCGTKQELLLDKGSFCECVCGRLCVVCVCVYYNH